VSKENITGLRTEIVRGGTYLALRQGVVIVVNVVGMLLLTREIGPGPYGIYIACFDLLGYFGDVMTCGVNVYLIRKDGDIPEEDYHQAFTLLLLLSIVGIGVGLVLLPLVQHWIRIKGFESAALWMLPSMPVVLMSYIPLAHLEHALDYRRVATIEVAGRVAFYVVALPLAFSGGGVWAPVAGWWSLNLLQLIWFYSAVKLRPRLFWKWNRLRPMMNYGIGYSASTWIFRLRNLVNSLVVGRILGAQAVGYVALCMRIAQVLTFIKTVAARLSIAALARVQNDVVRLGRAVTEGMTLQVLATGPFLTAFAIFAPWIIPRFFGQAWWPATEIFPFIAAAVLTDAVFSMHISALYVRGRNWGVATFGACHVLILAVAAWLLVHGTGVTGYGWAEVLALPSYLVLHWLFRAMGGKVNYSQAAIWYLSCVICMFGWQLGPWAWPFFFVPFVVPGTRKNLKAMLSLVWEKRKITFSLPKA
jgi:O-antigen/teichoic acid export membrane protein